MVVGDRTKRVEGGEEVAEWGRGERKSGGKACGCPLATAPSSVALPPPLRGKRASARERQINKNTKESFWSSKFAQGSRRERERGRREEGGRGGFE